MHLANLYDDLENKGWSTVKDIFTVEELLFYLDWAKSIPLNNHKTKPSKKHADHHGEHIYWLADPNRVRENNLNIQKYEFIKNDINEHMNLGLCHVESHITCYAPKAKYSRHFDSFDFNNKRVISLNTYLNVGWKEEDGGLLRLHTKEGIVDIPPLAGTTVVFLSSEIEHEVLKTHVDRWSISAWFTR